MAAPLYTGHTVAYLLEAASQAKNFEFPFWLGKRFVSMPLAKISVGFAFSFSEIVTNPSVVRNPCFNRVMILLFLLSMIWSCVWFENVHSSPVSSCNQGHNEGNERKEEKNREKKKKRTLEGKKRKKKLNP
jgi:hypothetical protein